MQKTYRDPNNRIVEFIRREDGFVVLQRSGWPGEYIVPADLFDNEFTPIKEGIYNRDGKSVVISNGDIVGYQG